ncbi:MAG: TlpA family protein disulfide reductase [Niabella sp.]
MKYILLLFTFIFTGLSSFAQQNEAPYLKYKTVPSARLLLSDSTGVELKARLDKKKPLMIVVFSPECDHCKHEAEELVKNIDKFKKIQIVMVSMLPIFKMNEFVKHYGLDKYSNILVGRDIGYVFPVYYDIKSLPYHAFYNKDKKLIMGFEGSMSVEKILAQFGMK